LKYSISFCSKRKGKTEKGTEKEIKYSGINTEKPVEFFETEPSMKTKQKSEICSVI